MHTRKIALTDAFYIAALSDQLGYAMSVENTAKQINAINKSTIDAAYVAVDDSKVIGWIHVFYTVRLESAPFCEIAGLVVGEQYRGKGAGKLLIKEVKKWCSERQCFTLRVRSNIKRTEAHKF